LAVDVISIVAGILGFRVLLTWQRLHCFTYSSISCLMFGQVYRDLMARNVFFMPQYSPTGAS